MVERGLFPRCKIQPVPGRRVRVRTEYWFSGRFGPFASLFCQCVPSGYLGNDKTDRDSTQQEDKNERLV